MGAKAATGMILAFLLAIGLGFGLVNLEATPAPVRPGQPHPDQFLYNGLSLAPLNPVNQKALAPAHQVAYRLVTMPGCNTGTVPQAMAMVEQEAQGKLRFNLVRNDVTYDFTVRINCGSEQIRICGAVNIFCLGRGYPYNADVELSDLLSTYTQASQLAIPLHEVVGHALATWDEQYCRGGETSGVCAGLPQFTPAPNWRDVMNTGPDSRHGLEAVELERWSRTMYDLAPAVEYQDCTTYAGWEPTVSCYWPFLGKWLWLVPAGTGDQLWEWSVANPQWTCSKGCPK